MRQIPNHHLTKNFTLYEMIEGQLPYEAVQLNWQNYDEFNIENAKKVLRVIQQRRDIINQMFISDTGDSSIGLRITSGFRCLAWERIRKRSGNSQHVYSLAGDVQPMFCSDGLAIKIIQWLYNQDNESYEGGLAIKYPKFQKIGFIHYDARGYRARWEY